MKRSAAIIGPTPAFLRWAVRHPCPLREIELENLPSSTFRQLRSLSEWSTASREGRVVDGVAFHPDTSRDTTLLGFPVDEIADAFGGKAFVQSSCDGCVANSQSDSGGFAGCFGLVQITDLPEILRKTEQAASRRDLYSQFKQTFHRRTAGDAAGDDRLNAAELWYGLWIERVIPPPAAIVLRGFVEEFRDTTQEWESFYVSLERCIQYKLDLHVELFSSGVSDGQSWRLDPHCATCKAPWDGGVGRDGSAAKVCQVCGEQWVQRAEKKRKVLGIRPYMQLQHIFGEKKCEELRSRYLDRL